MSLRELGNATQIVAGCIPIDLFSCCCVSHEWKDLWKDYCFARDLSTRRLTPQDSTAIAQRIGSMCVSLHLNLNFCDLSQAALQALLEHMPAGLRSLSLTCCGCNIREVGARAVAERIPVGLGSLRLDFNNCNIGELG